MKLGVKDNKESNLCIHEDTERIKFTKIISFIVIGLSSVVIILNLVFFSTWGLSGITFIFGSSGIVGSLAIGMMFSEKACKIDNCRNTHSLSSGNTIMLTMMNAVMSVAMVFISITSVNTYQSAEEDQKQSQQQTEQQEVEAYERERQKDALDKLDGDDIRKSTNNPDSYIMTKDGKEYAISVFEDEDNVFYEITVLEQAGITPYQGEKAK